MPKKIYNFQLPIKGFINSVKLEVVKNDIDGNQFNIVLTDNGEPFSLVGATQVTASVLKPDNTYSVSAATIVDAPTGKISILLSDQCVAVPGVCKLTVEVYTGSARITSAIFNYDVRDEILNGADPSSTSEYPLLLDLMQDIEDIKTVEAARVEAENGRVTAENDRKTAETNREATINAFKVLEVYNPGKIYVQLNKVTYNGSTYQAIAQSQGMQPDLNPSVWLKITSKGDKGDTGNKGVNWRDAYNAATAYAKDDAVSYNGSSYIALQASTGQVPTNATYWGKLAQKGADGAGSGDMAAAVYDTDMDGKVNAAVAADQVPWTGVQDKPDTYPPAVHNHDLDYTKVSKADATYYVDAALGNDSNDGLSSGTAFQTIAKAVSMIPKTSIHPITINLAAGTYNEPIKIYGVSGSGYIVINGGTDTTTALNYSVTTIDLRGCGVYISIKFVQTTITTYHAAWIQFCTYVRLEGYVNTIASSYSGVYVTASICTLETYIISNKSHAARSTNGAQVYSSNGGGTGNTYGLYAQYGGAIAKNGAQPTGTTNEATVSGGIIAGNAERASFKSGSATFTTRGTQHIITDVFCTASSFVTISITSATKPQGIWSVDSQAGQFVITSDKAETVDITFDYYIMRGGV